MGKLEHVRIDTHPNANLSTVTIDGQRATNVMAYHVEAEVGGLTSVTLKFIPDVVELVPVRLPEPPEPA